MSHSIRVIWFIIVIFSMTTGSLLAQPLRVSDNQRFLVRSDGSPFFWLADTAWELFHRCDREEATMYLKKRKSQGFNVIQAVALAELDGLHTPNTYGETPLFNDDPATPNPAYFEHVDFIIDKAAELDMYIALLPTWGDKLHTRSWGIGPEVFNRENARKYGWWIGNRYKSRDNIIWIIGGDRTPRTDSDDVEVWQQMAKGIVEAVGGNDKALMSYHPQPRNPGGSSTWFHQDDWLDFNMHQTGHCPKDSYKNIAHDYHLKPTKPVLDGEPLYEDHPICFDAKNKGYSMARDIRRIMYWNVFAGAFGQTYGCHDVWQMYTTGQKGINGPLRPWPEALDLPMATQVRHLKNLMLSRPFLSRIPDQYMVVEDQEDTKDYVIATRDEKGAFAMIYFPTGKKTRLDLSALKGDRFKSWWYDPRTGNAYRGNEITNSIDKVTITPPTHGLGNDWVLVVDSENSEFPVPGQSLIDIRTKYHD